MSKLRLLVWADCNRNCKLCCNKNYNLNSLPVCTDFSSYEEIILTGGEPLLYPAALGIIIQLIRQQTDVPIYVYTASTKYLSFILDRVDGVTLTLHEEKDVKEFEAFDKSYERMDKSFRLNVFEGIKVECSERWFKKTIKWMENCPLPSNEVFMRL